MRTAASYDAIVVGVGAMGSAAAFHLACRGQRVLALEQFGVAHKRGSHHGETRIIRLAYHEDSRYVPLLLRAYELWHDLERFGGEQLLRTVGSLDVGREDDKVIRGSLAACRQHDLKHTILDTRELRARFPAYQPEDGVVAVFQPDGGFLLPERCVGMHASAATAKGAMVKERERVVAWESTTDHLVVRTNRATYTAARLVLCAGAWSTALLRLQQPLLTVQRQVVAWLKPLRADLFEPSRFPVFIAESEGDNYYGFPIFGAPGIKLGRMNHPGEVVYPNELTGVVTEDEVEPLRKFARRHFPSAVGRTLATSECLFTNTPDKHFIVDLPPYDDRVVIASVCSGHGFKFASVIGEVLADLATEQKTRHQIEFLGLDRFRARDPAKHGNAFGEAPNLPSVLPN